MVLRIEKTSCPRDCFGECTMSVQIEDGRIVKIIGDERNRATGGILCVKGISYMDYVYSSNRIKYPMVRCGGRGEGSFKRVSWEYAIEQIGEKIKGIREDFGSQGIMYYSSGGCSGMMSEYHSGFFNQLGSYTTTRGNLCYPAGIEATKLTYGEVKHNAPWDMENAGLIILWGKNPAYTNVQEMKFTNNAIAKGCKLVTIDPIRNASSNKSVLHIQPEPGTDGALALCIANLLIQRGSINKEFIDKYTYGFNAFKSYAASYTPSEISRICRIGENEIYSLVNLIENNRPMTLVCGYGLQRYKNGGQTVRAISVLPALTGDIGVKGGGFRFANKQAKKLRWPFTPDAPATIRDDYPAGSLGKAIESYKNPGVKMLWVERANPLTMNPDINALKRSMDGLDFIVVVDQFLTDTALYGDMILPAQSFFEYDDIFTGYWTPEYGGGEIWFDDRLIRKDGLFVIPELEVLNPDNLK